MDSTVMIITPVYNCGKYIGETMQSVLTQAYPNLEYIVIDDASTDKVGPYKWSKKRSWLGWDNGTPITQTNPSGNKVNLNIINHEKNQGEQHTVNEGLELVRGKYFMIVNADDPLLPGAVNNLVAFMEANPDVLCGYPDYNVIGENGEFRRHVISKEYDFNWMVRHHTWLPSVGSIFRSEVIKKIGYRDTSFRWLGDADYWLRVGLAGKMAHEPMILACWRHRDGQASSQKSSERAREHIRVMQKFFTTPNLPQILLDVKAEATCWSYLVAAAVTSSKVDIIKYIAKAVWRYPQLLVNIEFWDTLIKRALYILRR